MGKKYFLIAILFVLGTVPGAVAQIVTPWFGATTASTGYASLNVTFRDSTTGTHLRRWHWVWDASNPIDTAATTTNSFSHNYTASGFYTVKMVVYDSLGNVDSVTRTNYVDVRPKAGFTASPLAGYAPLVVHFTNTTTGGAMWKYHFQFDTTNKADTQVVVGSTFNFNHTYSVSGIYAVKLIAYDTHGQIDSITQQHIDTVRPQCKFSLSPQNGCVSLGNPLHVTLTDASTGGRIWKWYTCFDTSNHSDTSSSPFTANPITTYTAQGTYVVKHVVYDSLGNRDSLSLLSDKNRNLGFDISQTLVNIQKLFLF
jgi:PKD repeat protein